MSERHQTRCNRGCRTAARPPNRTRQIPRFSGRFEAGRLGCARRRQLRAGALPDDDRPKFLKSGCQGSRGPRGVTRTAKCLRADPRRRAGQLLSGIFQQHRHSSERLIEINAVDALPGSFEQRDDHARQLRVGSLDSSDRFLDNIGGSKLSRTDQRSDLNPREPRRRIHDPIMPTRAITLKHRRTRTRYIAAPLWTGRCPILRSAATSFEADNRRRLSGRPGDRLVGCRHARRRHTERVPRGRLRQRERSLHVESTGPIDDQAGAPRVLNVCRVDTAAHRRSRDRA